eukprot:CAMPEP_0119376124 /NCGR_PEP_ID=MMETSP1334-20130426/39019_1 /TAXON_ID=127549 /ORGANISM="Calcidiscus leptoporus, Strain RCC1130" /LENGTH=153 /DNA_ID=CAMNT_0007394615 /DNA_START=307 /DNA_END=769 /DNA_ORIENTATION=+
MRRDIRTTQDPRQALPSNNANRLEATQTAVKHASPAVKHALRIDISCELRCCSATLRQGARLDARVRVGRDEISVASLWRTRRDARRQRARVVDERLRAKWKAFSDIGVHDCDRTARITDITKIVGAVALALGPTRYRHPPMRGLPAQRPDCT